MTLKNWKEEYRKLRGEPMVIGDTEKTQEIEKEKRRQEEKFIEDLLTLQRLGAGKKSNI